MGVKDVIVEAAPEPKTWKEKNELKKKNEGKITNELFPDLIPQK